ncbi:MAG: hypothetical protein EOO70_04110 [Myxococcaceae bacterium]|nr:MAG: hypothetical protein EOO70_04110 [Myxococcaceae bacterium]
MEDADKLYGIYLKNFALARSGVSLDEKAFSVTTRHGPPALNRNNSETVDLTNRELVAMAMGVAHGRNSGDLTWSKSEVVATVTRLASGEG